MAAVLGWPNLSKRKGKSKMTRIEASAGSQHSTSPFIQTLTSCPSHAALLKAAAKIPLGPIVDEQPPTKDIFDNPFIPTTPIPYLPHDFCKLDSTGSHVDRCSSPDPSVWRVVKDEKFTFVFPRDLGHFVEFGSPAPKPKPAYTFRFSYWPTLDEFMSSRDQYRDSDVFFHRGTGLGPRPTNPRQLTSKPTASVVAKRKASLPLASQDDDMAVDSDANAVALRSSNTIPSPQSSPYYGDDDASDGDEDNDDDNYELPVTKRKARKPLKKPTKKQDPRPTVTSRPALRESVNEQSRKVYACPFDDCERVCSTRGDLERHLVTKDHKQPSVPCPRGCGIVFTRRDAAKRHARQGSCGGKKTKKTRAKVLARVPTTSKQ